MDGIEKTFSCKYKGNTTMSPDGRGNYHATKRRCNHPDIKEQPNADVCGKCKVYESRKPKDENE